MARLFATLLAAAAVARPALAAGKSGVRSYIPAAKQASSGNVVSSNVLSLKKGTKAAESARHLRSIKHRIVSSSNSTSGYEHVDNLLSEEYVAEIEFDGVPVQVIIDTGSSDTYVFWCCIIDPSAKRRA